MLRPQACRWFELVATREDLAPLLEVLARTGAVELQTQAEHGTPLLIAGVDRLLDRYESLARTHRDHWPAPRPGTGSRAPDPAATLAAAIARLEAWQAEADPLLVEREHGLAEQRRLDDLDRLLAAADELPAPALLAAAGRCAVELRLYLGAKPIAPNELSADLLVHTLPLGDEHAALVLGQPAQMAAVDALFEARHARRLDWPAALAGSAAEAVQQVAAWRAAADARRRAIDAALQALSERHGLAAARADIERIAWLVHHGTALAASDRLVWVTGWTTADDEAALLAPLQRAGLQGLLQFGPPPADAMAPSRLANPPWARAFETFARLLGQPGRDEADPSPLLALIAPLLFGFMFGDVGQGAVLIAAGLLLRRRVPALVMLIPGGAMAMVFGLLFGSVFAREDLIPALWLHPLQQPVTLLIAAIALGALILLGGLALNALQAAWRRDWPAWWAQDAGLLLAYGGALAAVWWPLALWALPAGALWMAIGGALTSPGARAAAFGRGLAQFVEQALQLAVNTVSFARVGAFALAHAGLSAAVTGVADAVGPVGQWIVLILGNLLILLLEGLVVGIQTTRLLLFEFFLRFLKGNGRVFRPLPPPATLASP
jgi:V/A-type H+-transporting ATPase subunit I